MSYFETERGYQHPLFVPRVKSSTSQGYRTSIMKNDRRGQIAPHLHTALGVQLKSRPRVSDKVTPLRLVSVLPIETKQLAGSTAIADPYSESLSPPTQPTKPGREPKKRLPVLLPEPFRYRDIRYQISDIGLAHRLLQNITQKLFRTHDLCHTPPLKVFWEICSSRSPNVRGIHL